VRALKEQDANFITRDRTYNPASTARPDRPLDDEKGGLQAIGNNQNLSLSIAHDGHERSRIDETIAQICSYQSMRRPLSFTIQGEVTVAIFT
jgi:hypothetical protein